MWNRVIHAGAIHPFCSAAGARVGVAKTAAGATLAATGRASGSGTRLLSSSSVARDASGTAAGSSGAAAAAAASYFKLFPKTFPHGGPPDDPFPIRASSLRKEYRLLQSEHHPDVAAAVADAEGSAGTGADYSSLVNRAYTTVRNPYTRLAHAIQLHHPKRLDITQDEVAKGLIAEFQSTSPEAAAEYKTMLMLVLDAHESLEMAESEADLEELSDENDARLRESEHHIDALLAARPIDWEAVVLQAIQLKYWVNIQNGIKDWEQGKPVHLTH